VSGHLGGSITASIQACTLLMAVLNVSAYVKITFPNLFWLLSLVMIQNMRELRDEIQSVSEQISLLLDDLLTPNPAALKITAADVQKILRVRALLPKVAQMAELMESIGVDLAPDPSLASGFSFDTSKMRRELSKDSP
jgi:hypothetical protein